MRATGAGGCKTPTSNLLEPLYYTAVQHSTTYHPLWVLIFAWKNGYK